MKKHILLVVGCVVVLCVVVVAYSKTETEGVPIKKDVSKEAPKTKDPAYVCRGFDKNGYVLVEDRSVIDIWFDIEYEAVVGPPKEWEDFLYLYPMRQHGKLAIGDEVEIFKKGKLVFVKMKSKPKQDH